MLRRVIVERREIYKLLRTSNNNRDKDSASAVFAATAAARHTAEYPRASVINASIDNIAIAIR